MNNLYIVRKDSKQEQNIDSPLVTQAAREVETSCRKITEQLDEIDTNMQRYINLCVQTVTETGEGVLEHKILVEMHQFNEQFVKYIKSGFDQAPPEGVIFSQACINIDEFWLDEVKSWGFSKETNLEDFIVLIEDVAIFKYPIITRRMELFEATQTTDDPFDYIRDLTIKSASIVKALNY